MATPEERIAALETRLTLYKYIGGTALVILLCLYGITSSFFTKDASGQASQYLDVKGLTIRDSAGKPRVTIRGSEMVFFDKGGKTRIQVGTNDSEANAFIYTFNAKQVGVFEVRVDSIGRSTIHLNTARGGNMYRTVIHKNY